MPYKFKNTVSIKNLKINRTYLLKHNYKQTISPLDNNVYVIPKIVNRYRIILKKANGELFHNQYKYKNIPRIAIPVSTRGNRWGLHEVNNNIHKKFKKENLYSFKDKIKYIKYKDIKSSYVYIVHSTKYGLEAKEFLPTKVIKMREYFSSNSYGYLTGDILYYLNGKPVSKLEYYRLKSELYGVGNIFRYIL